MLALFDAVLGTNRRLRHDATKLIQLGSATTDHYVCIGRSDAPIKTFKQALTEEWLIGASQPGTSTRDYPAMLNNTTGAKIKQVSGYPGTREITLAIEKNEVHGLCGFSWSSLNAQKPDWVKSGFIRVIVQEHDKGNPEINKMGVPLAVVFAAWYRSERTLSIHSIDTLRRESFYWPTVLFTLALGTAAGDLVAERMALGYWVSAVLFRPRPGHRRGVRGAFRARGERGVELLDRLRDHAPARCLDGRLSLPADR